MDHGSPLNFAQFIDWIFLGGIAFLAQQGVKRMGELSESINQLNTKMALVIATTSTQDKRIETLEGRVHDLEMAVWKKRI